jgi:hypothetical protein
MKPLTLPLGTITLIRAMHTFARFTGNFFFGPHTGPERSVVRA